MKNAAAETISGWVETSTVELAIDVYWSDENQAAK
jgi:hypothetical protein